MPQPPTTITDELGIALSNLADSATGVLTPTLRLGVTGLSRAGKTIFITSLIHNLLTQGRLPGFAPLAEGRFIGAKLAEYPDATIPRFAYEQHMAALTGKPATWPESTRRISQLRIVLKYQSAKWWAGFSGPATLNLDIVDYPGEWLLDLPLLAQDFRTFSANTVALAQSGIRAELARDWLALSATIDPAASAEEATARTLAEAFTAYLRACKSDERSLSTLPPGRFLMPGDLEGSPALTFAPLPNLPEGRPDRGSLHAMMERRYEAYKTHVVRPFFREHFARLDRQIVLIDALQAINRGAEAVHDLERALGDVLDCFRAGTNSFLSSFVTRRIDRIVIAATKADHLHHESHARLEAVTRRLVERAIERIGMSGAGIEVMALASVRATREATVKHDGEDLPVIVGVPMAGERINGEIFDGERKTAIFPGDLPKDPDSLFKELESVPEGEAPHLLNFVRFRPPHIEETGGGLKLSVPHIRLDRALQYLIGDRLA